MRTFGDPSVAGVNLRCPVGGAAFECKQIIRGMAPVGQNVDTPDSFIKCRILLKKIAAKNRGHVLTCEPLASVSEDNFQRFMCLLGNRLAEGRWLPDGPFQTSKTV